jgi:hypothetical protein
VYLHIIEDGVVKDQAGIAEDMEESLHQRCHPSQAALWSENK